MNPATYIRIAALFGFSAVALGAFGAHGLKDLFLRNGYASVWEKAVLYHLVHSVLLLFLATRNPFPRTAWLLFACGILLFSGSLYLLAVTGIKWLGAITPFGGLALLAGWIMLVLRA